jgi:hypothetical protein
VCVYLGRGVSVDGVALRKVLESAKVEASVFSFDPPRFVHAKLVAIIKGAKARILSGSANLSRAALTSTLSGQAWANVEACVLTEVTAEAARALFRPPDLELVPVALEDLAQFELGKDDDVPQLPLRLFSARPDSDGRIEVTFEGLTSSDVFLTSRSGPMALHGSRTVDVFALDPTDVLVWLSDQAGERISNRVPLDDPAALHRQLETPSSRASDRPREFDSSDLQNPVVQILARLNSEYIFDLDELDSMAQAERANENETPEAEAGHFWERLAREELQLDPRAGAYRRFGGETPFEGDDVLLLLRMMLDRTPEERHSAIGATDPKADDDEHPQGTPWTMTQRLQVRLMNVLTRWARALADPRMNWLQPFAAVRNFEVLLYALAELWELGALPEPKL